MSLSQSCVAKLYATVIDDVVSGVREFFMDEGVDEQVLLELKQSWETKLKTTKAVELPKPEPEPQPPLLKNPHPPALTHPHPHPHHKPPTTPAAAALVVNNQPSPAPLTANNHSKVSIQITLPGVNQTNEARQLTIEVPSSALAGNQLHSVLTGPVISATMALPPPLATTLLQQHVNAALQGHTSSRQSSMPAVQSGQTVQNVQGSVANGSTADSVLQQRQTYTHQGGVPQTDGVRDSSDEDDNEEEDNDDDDDHEDEEKDEDEEHDPEDQQAVEEEPLNSEDDVSEDDPGEMFETDNVVVCQYDKITRSRNKWKFYLKDGIMNLGGKDFVFQKSSGDAEW